MDDLDRILISEEAVTPSASFTARVMERIAVLTAEPAPRPFPWNRFAIGLLACASWAACAAWLIEPASVSTLPVPAATLATVIPALWYAAAAVSASLAVLRVYEISGR
jgi:hypothetical protein